MTFEALARVRQLLHSHRPPTDEAVAQVSWNDGFEITTSFPKEFNWMKRGACCRSGDDVNWFPDVGESANPAKAVCRSCIVQSVCREHAIDRHELGIWGGTTEQERALIRRTRRMPH